MTKRTTDTDIHGAVFSINGNATGELSRWRYVFHFMVEDHSQMVRDVEGSYPASYFADGIEDAQTRDAQLAIALLLANKGKTERVGDIEVSRVIKAMPYIVGVYYLSDSLDRLYLTTAEDGDSTHIMSREDNESKKAWVGRLKAYALAMRMVRVAKLKEES